MLMLRFFIAYSKILLMSLYYQIIFIMQVVSAQRLLYKCKESIILYSVTVVFSLFSLQNGNKSNSKEADNDKVFYINLGMRKAPPSVLRLLSGYAEAAAVLQSDEAVDRHIRI